MSETREDSERLRIAFVIDSIAGWTAGGTERQLAKLIGSLDLKSFEPALYVLKATTGLKSDELPFPVRVLNSRARWHDINLLWNLRKEFSHFRPHIVQTFFYDATVFGTIGARLAGVPIVVQSRRSVGYGQLRLLKRIALRIANRLTTSWQCNSQFVADYIREGERIPEKKIKIIPNIIDSEYFAPSRPSEREAARRKLGFRADAPIFICVSNLRPIKDLTTLVKAAVQVYRQIPDVQFAVVGEGPLQKELTTEIDQLKLNGTFWLAGRQSDVRTWLIAADIGIVTSRSEGSSNALLEYLATGLPAVVSDIPANRELVPGIFFRAGDPSDLAEKLLRLWQDPNQRKRMRSEYQEKTNAHRPDANVLHLRKYYSDLRPIS